MIYEHAILSIQSGREDEFESAFAAAPAIFARADGCHGAELRRSIEQPSQYELIVGWDDVETHTERFRGSPLFSEWRGLVGEFFATPPTLLHYRTV
jgi:heme-degrading monooxygenase HmoA